MKKETVIIEQYAMLSALGTLSETIAGLLKGSSAIQEGPCFGLPAGYAPFTDTRLRNVFDCADALNRGIDLCGLNNSRTLFVYCAAKGDIRYLDATGNPAQSTLPSPLPGHQAEAVKRHLKLEQSDLIAVSNACASGLIGVETACELLHADRYDHAVVFGFDTISRFVTTGFHSLGALSPTRARPFDKTRDGLSLGDGAAICVLTKRTALHGDAVILGSGSSNDANHRTGPSRTGEGLFHAVCGALQNAGCAPESIGAVKCHGTATPYNDAMEAKAIRRVFDRMIPPCFSVKGSLGHTSGGGSLLEMLVAVESITHIAIPPTVGFQEHGVDELIPISASMQQISKPAIVCLSAGFGGVNAAAVVGVAV